MGGNRVHMLKKLIILVSFALMSSLLSGCGQLLSAVSNPPKDSKASENTSDTKGQDGQNQEDVEGATAPQETYQEIKFQPINWINGAPDPQPTPGVWVYTKEKHPGNLEDSFTWDEEDVLLVQIGNPEYEGYEMTPTNLQIIKPDVVRVVVKLEKDEFQTEEKEPARVYMTVKRGSLDGKKFIVVDQNGKKLQTK
jgi:hypothetical protein